MHHPQEQFEVHIRPTITNPIKSSDLQKSWMANYLRKPRNDRILWESKLYKFERSYAAKSLPEKTEELMDLVTLISINSKKVHFYHSLYSKLKLYRPLVILLIGLNLLDLMAM